MRSEKLGIKESASLTDLKSLRHSYAVPPLLKRRGYKWGFFIKLKVVFKVLLLRRGAVSAQPT